jgi:hypothetical protein
VYRIIKDNQVYIGSTTNGFRKRFIQHTHETNKLPITKEMLDNGAIFEIVWIALNNEDTKYIREMEKYYIKYYKEKNYIVINKRNFKDKIKYKTIKIKEDNYKLAMQ